MKLLFCAATAPEIAPLLDFLQKEGDEPERNTFHYQSHLVKILITGIGGAATAFSLGKILQQERFDLVIQAGIAGAFSPDVAIGSLWKVSEECFADAGAETREGFSDLFDLHLQESDRPPFKNRKLPAYPAVECSLSLLPSLSAISVNRVSGSAATIAERMEKYHPQLESMEGAAFFYACLLEKVPFIEIRSISNHVEVRDTSKWNIGLAVGNLNDTLIRFLKDDVQ